MSHPVLAAVLLLIAIRSNLAQQSNPLTIEWEKNFLTIRGEIPGGELKTLYLEAYCRPGSTDREWRQTVIPHTAEVIESSADGKVIKLRDTLADGVIVEHTVTAGKDDVDFHLIANNPTNKASEAHWAQPCIRVDQFTGTTKADAKAVVPQYARKCFLFVDGQLSRLPTYPWAMTAHYVPGQVYAAPGVDRNDVNPRPLSSIVPTSGLCGCFSGDEKQIMAVAWEPYQELFQGVLACIHSDFRIGGLEPGETKKIHGKIYIVPADVPVLVKRYERDFETQAKP
jgi:hypothetical protein